MTEGRGLDYDSKLIEALRSGGEDREMAVRIMIKDPWFVQCAAYLSRQFHLDNTQERSLMGETIVAFINSLERDNFKEGAKAKNYIQGIMKHIAFSKKRTGLRYHNLKRRFAGKESESDLDNHVPELDLLNEDRRKAVNAVLNKLGERCQHILNYWSMGYAMREIQKKLDIVSEEATRKAKHDCLKRVISKLEKQPEYSRYLKSLLDES